jgi:hypothetical protein
VSAAKNPEKSAKSRQNKRGTRKLAAFFVDKKRIIEKM